MSHLAAAAPRIEYPDRDGKPMADNTKQARWMTVLFGNLSALFRDVTDVFVAMDLLWYAVEGHPEVRIAPDVMVVFGRPKGDRGSYKQWEEGGIPATVAFEVLSPGNTFPEMDDKLAFYEEHGVEEYYVYDPDQNRLMAFVRRGEIFRRIRPVQGFTSPRLGIRFDLSGPEMAVYGPNGNRFLTFEELQAELERAQRRAGEVQRRADRQAELMRRVVAQQATAEEIQELQQLLQSPT
jgi:Uma2 family endonuclease